ncbi:hypothetical protein BBK36DRAFT_1141562 [Trichoderma citrinoviride]|uniref:Uncharacterized protein n=1 Tax=Trichoderma citrinoviride TaxID=58853 RepID=A0A2T4B8R9_9HYPO|nr:hypothetical protein BBK36DRAFT_1141562 [Trichoderma citrinoviride]PTB65609.1 hypothetical protein BBK36DRAFT_1141562 [Trichoderma citrinoviride]
MQPAIRLRLIASAWLLARITKQRQPVSDVGNLSLLGLIFLEGLRNYSSTSQQADNGLTDAISECEAARPFEVDLSRINKQPRIVVDPTQAVADEPSHIRITVPWHAAPRVGLKGDFRAGRLSAASAVFVSRSNPVIDGDVHFLIEQLRSSTV